MAKGNSDGRAKTGSNQDETSEDGKLVIDNNSDSDSMSIGSLIIHAPDGNPSDNDDCSGISDIDELVHGTRSIEDYEDPVGTILGKPISDKPEEPEPIMKEVKRKRCQTCGENILLTNFPKHFHIHPPSKYHDAAKLERDLQELIIKTAYEIMPGAFGKGKVSGMAPGAANSTSDDKPDKGGHSGSESDQSGFVQKIFIRPLKEIHRKPELLEKISTVGVPVPAQVTEKVAPVEVPVPAQVEDIASPKKPKVVRTEKMVESVKKTLKHVAKKSCSKKHKKVYLSESDEPVTPTKTLEYRGKYRERDALTPEKESSFNGAEASEEDLEPEDDVPLIVRLRQEAEARGEVKTMPKPPPRHTKKRPVARSETESASKRQRAVDPDRDSGHQETKKAKKPKQPTILKKSNPNWNKHVEAAAEVIASETKKDNPDVEALEKAMKKTFPYRKYMYDRNTDIAQVLAVFPALHDYRFVKKEFENIGSDLATLERKLVDPLMLEYQKFAIKYYLSPDAVVANAKEELKKDPSDKVLLRDIQLLCLGFTKTGGKLLGTLYRQREANEAKFKGVTPTIDIKNNLGNPSCKLTVYCEKMRICEVSSFFDAVMCVYALYWIFNLQYEASAKSLFEYFDTLIGN